MYTIYIRRLAHVYNNNTQLYMCAARAARGHILLYIYAGAAYIYLYTSGWSIRSIIIRHELHSHAHLHSRVHINIQRGRKT